MDRWDAGVSPMVGTVLILGISIAGSAVALLLGAPALERLQEQSAVDTMVAQFQTVHEAVHAMAIPGDGRALGLSMPTGVLLLQPGTHWMVTSWSDDDNPDCDQRILDWVDRDDIVHLVSVGGDCRDLADLPNTECSLAALAEGVALPDTACVTLSRLDGATEVPVGVTYGVGTTQLDLGEDLDEASDYVFRWTDRADAVYGEAWLLRTDQLHWTGGRVAVDFEWGAVIAHGRGGDYLASQLRVNEGVDDPGPDDPGPLLLVLPTLRIEHGGQVSGTGTRTLTLALNASYVRHQGTSYITRLDFGGDNGETLCKAFLDRNDVSGVPWVADGTDGACGLASQPTTPAAQDDTMSLRFDPANGASASLRPQLVITHMAFALRLQP